MDIIITLLPAFISAGATLVVCLITNHAQASKTQALIEYRLKELEKKVDKHNNLIDRTYKLEEHAVLQAEKIKVANHRLDDLEKSVNKTE